jgi:hypothetical protein
VAFASDAYFDLLNARPELGEPLALGEEMIIVIDGAPYRITADASAQTDATPPGATEIAETFGQTDPTPTAATDGAPADSSTGAGLQVCGSAVALTLLATGWGATRRRKRA